MKAIYVNRYGGLDALEYGDVPDPVAGAGEVVVDIHAASVNAADVKVREGATKNTSTPRADTFPCILGRDFSGVVAAVGEESLRRRHPCVRCAGAGARRGLRRKGGRESRHPGAEARKPLARRGCRYRADGFDGNRLHRRDDQARRASEFSSRAARAV